MRRFALPALLVAAVLAAAAVALAGRETRPSAPVTLARGTFDGVTQQTTGTATLVALPDGRRKLRFEGFSTRAAPDLFVYLVPGASGGEIEGGTRIDRLESVSGAQEYVLPAAAPGGEHATVVIWCDWCDRPFAAAELTPT